jgi:hypothetical protein
LIWRTLNLWFEPRRVFNSDDSPLWKFCGVHKPGADLVTIRMLGCFRGHALTRKEFLGRAT